MLLRVSVLLFLFQEDDWWERAYSWSNSETTYQVRYQRLDDSGLQSNDRQRRGKFIILQLYWNLYFPNAWETLYMRQNLFRGIQLCSARFSESTNKEKGEVKTSAVNQKICTKRHQKNLKTFSTKYHFSFLTLDNQNSTNLFACIEFREFFKATYKRNNADADIWFNVFDDDHRGHISVREILSYKTTPTSLNEMMASIGIWSYMWFKTLSIVTTLYLFCHCRL